MSLIRLSVGPCLRRLREVGHSCFREVNHSGIRDSDQDLYRDGAGVVGSVSGRRWMVGVIRTSRPSVSCRPGSLGFPGLAGSLRGTTAESRIAAGDERSELVLDAAGGLRNVRLLPLELLSLVGLAAMGP